MNIPALHRGQSWNIERKESQERKRSTGSYLAEAETSPFKSTSAPVLMNSYMESGGLSLTVNWWSFKLAGSLALGHPQRRLISLNIGSSKVLHPSDAANAAKISKDPVSTLLQQVDNQH